MLASHADLTLSVEGGLVAREVRAILAYSQPRRRHIILIHGYNVAERAGIRSMGRFRDLLKAAYPPLAPEIFTASWPGRQILREAHYPWTIKRARAAALPLLREIRRKFAAPGAGELVLVAHSLGCRLVLELLARLAHFPRPQGLERLSVILMAPAVPVPMADAGGALHAAQSVADELVVLHSSSDLVLSLLFGLGETLAGEGIFPEAVGLQGKPFPVSARRNMRPAGHDNYWSNAAAAEAVCQVLRVPMVAAALERPAALAPELHLGRDISAPVLPLD
jgi:pimeloyl-ACP methyl ester carboxylesterase